MRGWKGRWEAEYRHESFQTLEPGQGPRLLLLWISLDSERLWARFASQPISEL
jgi:hypothetical protein